MSARAAASTTPGLSTAAVIAKAIELIETTGLEALSMRRVAEAFGIQAASIYWWVTSKDCLLDLVADELTRQAAQYLAARKRPCGTPALQLTHLAYLYRGFLYAHPQSELLLASRLVAGPHRARLVGVFIEDLVSTHGVPAAQATAAAAAVRSLVHGCVIEQHARHAVIVPATGQAGEASLGEFQQAMATATVDATGQARLSGPPATGLLAASTDVAVAVQAMITGLLSVADQADRAEQAVS
ncbi:MAG: TetR family transcriptional regulator [Jatrophihabitantaceae bacterium]